MDYKEKIESVFAQIKELHEVYNQVRGEASRSYRIVSIWPSNGDSIKIGEFRYKLPEGECICGYTDENGKWKEGKYVEPIFSLINLNRTGRENISESKFIEFINDILQEYEDEKVVWLGD